MDSRVYRVNYLIKKIQKGDEKALDELFTEFGALFLSMARKYLFDKSYAEDLLGDVFLDLCRKKAISFRAGFNGLNWIFTIIRRKAYNHNNLYGNVCFYEDVFEEKSLMKVLQSVDYGHKDDVDRIFLKNAMEKLSDYENRLLYYKFWEGLTVREIALKLSKPRSSVQYDIKKTMEKLSKLLNETDTD